MKEIKRVPKLRFKDLNEEWKVKSLGEIGSVSMCKRIMKDQTSISEEIPFYKIGTFGKEPDAFISKSIYDTYKKKYSFPTKGDILISASGTIGRTVVYDGEPAYFQDSNIVWIANEESLVLNSFLVYCYENVNWNTENTTIARLYNNNLRSIKISIPSLPEQQKIATFLSSVDKKIDQLQQKKSLLEQYKKGVMQQLFSQQLRFKDDNGNDYPDWEEKKLGNFKTLIHGDGDWILSKDISLDGVYNIVQLGNIGFGKYVEKDLKTISLSKFDELKGTPIQKGDLLINRMVDGNLNCCILNKEGNYITSVDVCWIRENNYFNNYFMMLLIMYEKNQNKLLSLSSGSGRIRISKKNLFNEFSFQLPSIQEQTKIAHFLSAIDKKIELVNTQIENTQQFKKGLLQQMFV